MKVKMNVADALDYSTGQYLTALEHGRLSRRDAIHLANWSDVAIGLRAAINRLPQDHAIVILMQKAEWNERTIKEHLSCATAAAEAAVKKVRFHWTNYRGDGERWDALSGALEDADTSIKDLRAAAKVK